LGNSPIGYHYGKFPPANLDWQQLIPLLGPTSASLARYDGLLSTIPNADILLSPLTTQEAVLSSNIEGTNVTMGEVLEIEADSTNIPQQKRADVEEVLNYRKTLQSCVSEVRKRSLSQQILRAAHSLLMEGVRGRDKSPGQYRTEQNWIGARGCQIEQARFVPIAPEHLQSGMDAWESYLCQTSEPDTLVQLAILHAEFEALHPFKDGNGRLGRMIIPLYLFQRGVLKSPDLYMSGYLEANREEYQDRLLAVSRDLDWTGWVKYFLRGIYQQAEENARKAQDILALYDSVKKSVLQEIHSQYAIAAVDFIFRAPIFPSTLFVSSANIPKPTANRLLALLRKKGLLFTLREGKGRRPGVYAFMDLMSIAERR
jgi:Fic family protein